MTPTTYSSLKGHLVQERYITEITENHNNMSAYTEQQEESLMLMNVLSKSQWDLDWLAVSFLEIGLWVILCAFRILADSRNLVEISWNYT